MFEKVQEFEEINNISSTNIKYGYENHPIANPLLNFGNRTTPYHFPYSNAITYPNQPIKKI